MEWETVIGLEIHAQLNTKSKIFSAAATKYGAEPNSQACAVDLGLPGALPVLNKEVVSKAVKFGLAVDAHINRCDANVSIRPMGQEELGTRAELKNINSFKFLERAINLEVERQQDILEEGGKVAQETRLYDAVKHETRSMRSKEEANDYRYFPDPDLLPVEISDELMAQIKQELPELPQEKKARFITEFGLSEYDADVLTSQKPMADYFEKMIVNNTDHAKLCANWIMGELSASLNKHQIELVDAPIAADDLSLLVNRIGDDTISGKIAKDVFKAMWDGEGSAASTIKWRQG